MNIKKLSDLTGVNIETIRSYRKAGYLCPVRMPNGYYNYSDQDMISLFWVRKLRGYAMSMDQINEFFFTSNQEDLLRILEEKKAYIKHEITAMELAMRFIDLESRHILESATSSANNAVMFQSIDDKFDIYSLENRSERFRELYFSMTPTVLVPKEVLNGPMEDRMVPIRVGVGTYRYILEEHQIAVPEDAVTVPNGLNIAQMIVLDDFSQIHMSELAPMMTYAKTNNLTFLSDTTGYLMRVEIRNGKPAFHFRIRACIEQNNIKDPSVLAKESRFQY